MKPGSPRTNSRRAFPEAWAERKRFNTLRRLSQQAARAEGRTDSKSLRRLNEILGKVRSMGLIKDAINPVKSAAAVVPGLIQKGKGLLSKARTFITGGDR